MKTFQLIVIGALCAVTAFSRTASASVERFAVLIGNNAGERDEAQLRYAEQDAQKMREVLRDVGGFPAQNLLLLNGENATTVERSLIAVNDRIRAIVGQPGNQVVLFVYFSGHADASALHLSTTRLDVSLVEQLVRSSAATFRVLVLDACRSGALTRVKGGTAAPPFLLRMEDQLDSQGAVFLTSSASHEDAQESDELGGSFFTHYFRSGLLGAADDDNDGRVTLEEAYAYAYRWTLTSTSRTWAGTQHPTYRYDVRGRGGIAITEPRAFMASRGTAVFPPGRNYLVWQHGAGGAVAGEVPADAITRSLSLKPGRYFVRARASDHLLEGEIALQPGETVDVGDQQLRRIEYARLVRKGGGSGSVRGAEMGYGFHTPLQNASSLCHGGFFGYPIVFPSLALIPRIDACAAQFRNEYIDASIKELGASLAIAYMHDLPIFSVRMGASAGPRILRQDFTTNGRAPSRTTVGGQLGVEVGASADLGAGFYILVEEALRAYFFQVESASGVGSRFEPSIAFQQSVGLGKFW